MQRNAIVGSERNASQKCPYGMVSGVPHFFCQPRRERAEILLLLKSIVATVITRLFLNLCNTYVKAHANAKHMVCELYELIGAQAENVQNQSNV
jgi:hypothetical protein